MNSRPKNTEAPEVHHLVWMTSILLTVILFTGCGAKQNAKPSLLSKSEWRAKLVQQYGQAAQIGVVGSWKPSDFTKAMGQPDSTQTIESKTFWYYQCSDGTIQLSMDAGNLSAGLMQGRINDF